jgi:hypothetical protein
MITSPFKYTNYIIIILIDSSHLRVNSPLHRLLLLVLGYAFLGLILLQYFFQMAFYLGSIFVAVFLLFHAFIGVFDLILLVDFLVRIGLQAGEDVARLEENHGCQRGTLFVLEDVLALSD